MKRPAGFTVIPWLAALSLALLPTPALTDEDEDGEDGEERSGNRTPTPAVYLEECGACHVPYPPHALPAESWRGLMAGLDNHFGDDASLDPAQAATIRAWLRANAGVRTIDLRAPLRITRAPWFVREHDEISAALWRSPSVKSPSNCAACHRDANRRDVLGAFSERDVRLPRTPRPRPSPGESK